ncbi:MAG: nuclear transport factor 2 family protein [Terriglobia bacterium]
MNKLGALPKILLLLPLLALSVARADAQAVPALENIDSQAELNNAIASLDAALFDSYNRCDLNKFGAFLTENVEFYDDRDGLSVGREKQIEDLKKYICGKVTRELVPGTLQVYHLKGYGALEMGVHRFHHPRHDNTEPVGEAKFILLWQYKDGTWRIPRIISYDHHIAAK